MANSILKFAVCAFLLFAANAAASAQSLTNVSPQNEAVNAAIAKAKSTLNVFFARNAKPEPGDSGFMVKIRYVVDNNGGGEHIWADNVVRNGDTVSATIANEPRQIPNLKRGQRVTVPVSQLTDWMYTRDGKYRGAYTVRALVPFMTPADGEAMKRRLGPE